LPIDPLSAKAAAALENGTETEMVLFTRIQSKAAVLQDIELLHTRNHVEKMRAFAQCLLISLLVVTLKPDLIRCQEPHPPSNSQADVYTLQIRANLVILSATVQDRHHALVSGLGQDDFQIYEDGVLQPIKYFSHEDIPITVGILVDNSASMGPKRKDVIAAAMAFARISNPQDQMFVVNFNDHVTFALPASIPFTGERDRLQQALSGIRATGQTALYDGIAAGLDHLNHGNRDKHVLILISDGGDSASHYSLAQVTEIAKKSSAIIYAIGIFDEQDADQNPGVLNRFAKETGGKAYFPQSSGDLASICEEIAHDIRNQYTLAYIPTFAMQENRYRAIRVKASAHGHGLLFVRTRAGYSEPSVPQATASTGIRP
jgi:VWFA-related protein